MMTNMRQVCVAAAVLAVGSTSAIAGETTANAGITSNYLWRGLTQSDNEAAVSGGIDFAADSGFYIGTWASNVNYGAYDNFSYEHDVYFGYSGGDDDFTWDVGFLYYNYDEAAAIDFHEIYGSLGFGGFSIGVNILSGTEADEPIPALDFGFGQAYYLSLGYDFELENGMGISLHVGQHDGDFNEYFNFVDADPTTDFTYIDYSIGFSIGDFTFTISDTDLDELGPSDPLQNDDMKFVVSYGMEFGL